MARDETARERDSEQSLLDRRSYLRLVGGAAVPVTVAGASGSADAVSSNTITVPAGETKSLEVGSGETLANTLIDMTADGASAMVTTSGNGWAIRNVAFKGNHPGGHYLLNPAVESEDGRGVVENVYMGDGQTEGSAKGGIWIDGGSHYGTIDFRKVHVAHFIDNGLYGTDPGYDYHGSHGGVVNVQDSLFDSNNISNIRVGSIDGRTCRVENCVVRTGTTRACGKGCSSPGAKNSRGVWAWWGPVEVRDSDVGGDAAKVVQDGRAGDPEIVSKNTRWGSNADTDRVPDGVPMAAEEAVSGSSSSSATSGR